MGLTAATFPLAGTTLSTAASYSSRPFLAMHTMGFTFALQGQDRAGSKYIDLPDYQEVIAAEEAGQLTPEQAFDIPVKVVVTGSQVASGTDPVMHASVDVKDVFDITVARLSVYQGFSDNGIVITNLAPVNYDGTYAFPGWTVSNISTSTSARVVGASSAQSTTDAVFSLGYEISLETVNTSLTFHFYGNGFWYATGSGNIS